MRAPPGRACAIYRAPPGPSWRHPPRAPPGPSWAPSAAPEPDLSAARSTGTELAPSAARAAQGASWRHPPRATGAELEPSGARATGTELELSAAREPPGPSWRHPPRATGPELELSAAQHPGRTGAIRRARHRAELELSAAQHPGRAGAIRRAAPAPELGASWTRAHGAELGRWTRATGPSWSCPPRTGPQSPSSSGDGAPVAPVVAPGMVPRWRRWKSRRSPERTPRILHGAQPRHRAARTPSAPPARPLLARLYACRSTFTLCPWSGHIPRRCVTPAPGSSGLFGGYGRAG